MIYREIILILSMVALFWFISFKADQQFIALLKGKLFRKRRNLNYAHDFYKKKIGLRSSLLFSVSGFFSGTSIILISKGGIFLIIAVIISISLLILGTFFKVAAFQATERDLDEALYTAR